MGQTWTDIVTAFATLAAIAVAAGSKSAATQEVPVNGIKRFIEPVTISALSVLLCLVLLEGGSWVYVRHMMTATDATLEILEPQRMAIYRAMFPDLSDTEIRGLFFTYTQTYEPWVEFTNESLNHPLAHAKGLLRQTTPDSSKGANEPVDVYFFGGSTMQGVHVPDDRTIPSQFVKIAAGSPKVSVRAFNYGQPYYYLKQETMLFVSLLLDGKRPKVAVFLDGFNDFHQPGASVRRTPFFTPAIRWMFDQPYTQGISDVLRHTSIYRVITRSFRDKRLTDAVPSTVIYENYSLPNGVDREDAFRAIADNYARDVRFTISLCKANGVMCLFFLQPVPFVNYDRSGEIISMKDDAPEYKTGYERIKATLSDVEEFQSLDDAFLSPAQLPYVDAVHYSPYGTWVLADRIYRKLSEAVGLR